MPGNIWQSLCPIKLDAEHMKMKQELYNDLENKHNLPQHVRYGDTPEKQFEEIVNSFEIYNCDSERGKYANYHIKID